MPSSPKELAAVLRRRWKVLQALRETPRSKPELIEECDISRSTVDRAIEEIADQSICERDYDVGYRLTPNGKCLVDWSDVVRRSFAGIEAATYAGIQFQIDEPEDGILFLDADVVTGEAHAPDRPLRLVCEHLRTTPRLRGFTPVVVDEYVSICSERIEEGSLGLDLVIDSNVRRYLSEAYTRRFERARSSELARFRETPIDESVGLAIYGEDNDLVVNLLSYGDAGLEGVLETEARLAVSWAERRFEDLRQDAAPV